MIYVFRHGRHRSVALSPHKEIRMLHVFVPMRIPGKSSTHSVRSHLPIPTEVHPLLGGPVSAGL